MYRYMYNKDLIKLLQTYPIDANVIFICNEYNEVKDTGKYISNLKAVKYNNQTNILEIR